MRYHRFLVQHGVFISQRKNIFYMNVIGVSRGENLDENQYYKTADQVWAHKTAEIAPSASIVGSAIVGENTIIRHCALLRGSVLIGANCTIGNTVEIKNAV